MHTAVLHMKTRSRRDALLAWVGMWRVRRHIRRRTEFTWTELPGERGELAVLLTGHDEDFDRFAEWMRRQGVELCD